MPVYLIYVDADGDGTSGNDSATSMVARDLRNFTPRIQDYQYIRFDLTVVPAGETITGISLRTYQYLYSASKGVSKTYNVVHWDASTTMVSGKSWVSGTNTDDLSGSIGSFTKDDNNELRITVDPPPPNKQRAMTARTSDYGVVAQEPLLTVTTNAAVVRKKRGFAMTMG